MSDATCRICGNTYSERGLTRHLQSCLGKHADGSESGVHLKVTDAYEATYWLQLVARRGATLGDLDTLLRRVWLECCGHMSEFLVDGVRYDPWGGGGDDFGFGRPVRSGNVPIARVLPEGAEFSYVYDFGSSTQLEGRSYGRSPVSDELAVESPESTSNIVVVARNAAPAFECAECGEPARWVCTNCQWNGAGDFCAAHAPSHGCDPQMLLPMVNSPRVGVCGYVGPAAARGAAPDHGVQEIFVSAREVVDELLEFPPGDEAELAHRLGQADADEVRSALLDRAEAGLIGRHERPWVLAALGMLGLGDQRARLAEAAADAQADQEWRQFAFAALSTDEQVDMETLAGLVGADELGVLFADTLGPLLEEAEENPEYFMQLAELLLETGAPGDASMFELIEQQRRTRGLEAGLIYKAVLRDVTYEPLWPLLAAAVRDGGVAADASLLDEAAGLAEDDANARELRRLALELRTAGIEGGDAVEGVGLVGTCDGAGAFPIFIARRRPDGSFAVVNLLFRTTGELRDGFALPFEDRADVDALGEQMRQGAGTELVEVSVEAAAALCRRRLDAVEATVDFDALSEDIARAVVQARRLPADDAAVVAPAPADKPVSLERTRELLDAPAFRYWLLDVAELVEAQVEPPSADGSAPDDAWFDAALATLADTGRTAARVASLADHMAQWYALADQKTQAAEFARLAQMTREAPAQSPLVRTMLEKSLAAADNMPEAGDFGDLPVAQADDPILRRAMRQRFFKDVDTPTGFDVIHLAMACMSFVLLEALQGMIADRRQPRPDELYALAYDVGEIIAMCIVDADDQLPMLVAQRLLAQGLTIDDVGALMGPFLDQLDVYFDFVAPDALYAAMDAPDVPMANAFYD